MNAKPIGLIAALVQQQLEQEEYSDDEQLSDDAI
jgi:hypothetical protein